MGISEDIKQVRFNSEYEKVAVNIIYTANWLHAINTNRFRPYHISPQQYNILRILRGQHPNPATVNLLQERMLDRMSNASRLVEKLRKKGYVERHTSPEDRRRCDIIITPEGMRVLEQIDASRTEWEESLKNLNETEAETLNTLLDKLRQ